ncbi:putative 26S proteasome non-ATPase regulatory subunit 3 [Iris pallida]|uniref:26S proteasome non-ATPase regulatory subunit 3 n=1 Tax=Iris pallida TaxID=29817 RepID=A0AAX6DTP5_IRIPA|nr:putative 26S proteasome non-ATPase regulatory subunit 3 [Iris pallida]KAJ6795170.1 putative 26S proteasome non-ATPase regulatory subunit 3 [Iris pallida]
MSNHIPSFSQRKREGLEKGKEIKGSSGTHGRSTALGLVGAAARAEVRGNDGEPGTGGEGRGRSEILAQASNSRSQVLVQHVWKQQEHVPLKLHNRRRAWSGPQSSGRGRIPGRQQRREQ